MSGPSDQKIEQLANMIERTEGPRWRPALTGDDVRSVALQSAWMALSRHKPECGASIETFARLIGRQRLGMAARTANDLRRRGVMQFPGDDKGRPWEPATVIRGVIIPDGEREAFWRRVRAALSDVEFEIVSLRFRKGMTFAEIAHRRNRSASRMRQIWERAQGKLAASLEGWA